MPKGTILRQSLAFARGSILGYGLGLALLAYVIALFYPSVKESFGNIQGLFERTPKELLSLFGITPGLDLTSPEGFLQSELFAFMVPLILAIQAIFLGAHAIAGEEERGTLDVLLVQPVGRGQVVLEKWAALALALLLTGLLFFLGLLGGVLQVGMAIGVGRLAAATFMTVLLALFFGTLALGLGAFFGRRAWALAGGALVAVVSYLWHALVPLSSRLAPLQDLSPFYWGVGYDPLSHGINFAYLWGLLLFSALALLGGLARFAQRDLRA